MYPGDWTGHLDITCGFFTIALCIYIGTRMRWRWRQIRRRVLKWKKGARWHNSHHFENTKECRSQWCALSPQRLTHTVWDCHPLAHTTCMHTHVPHDYTCNKLKQKKKKKKLHCGSSDESEPPTAKDSTSDWVQIRSSCFHALLKKKKNLILIFMWSSTNILWTQKPHLTFLICGEPILTNSGMCRQTHTSEVTKVKRLMAPTAVWSRSTFLFFVGGDKLSADKMLFVSAATLQTVKAAFFCSYRPFALRDRMSP